MEKKRLDYLDMVKGVGILFVVLGHITYISQPVFQWIFSFHMPLFFIVSGFLIDIKDEPSKDLKPTVKKKFRGIIVPYLWFSLAYFIIDIFNIYVLKNIDLKTLIANVISSATFYGVSVLWFLPALFLAETGFLLAVKYGKKAAPFLPALIALAGYLINIRLANPLYDAHSDSLIVTSLVNFVRVFLRAAVGMAFVGYSYYIHRLIKKFCVNFDGLSSARSRIMQLTAGVIMLAGNIFVSTVNGLVGMQFMVFNNFALYYIAAFLGAFGIIFICKALPAVRLIEYYGRNSLVVMACHINFYILYVALLIAFKVSGYVQHAKHYVFMAVTVLLVFLLSIVVIEVINRFFPFVLGRPYVKKTGKASEKA